MRSPQFQISNSYQEDAARIISARRTAKIMHGAGDIAASGDEVECAFRDFLRRRLPAKYYVGHGHIVDKNLNVSPQLDVIVSDSAASPVLFEGEGGTQFFPFESVYAFGEIKSSYLASKRYIHAFAQTCEKIRITLFREKTPPNYLGDGVFLGSQFNLLAKVIDRNPLFTFMVFAGSGDVSQDDLLAPYALHSDSHLPNIVAFLDGIVLHKAELGFNGKAFTIEASVFGTCEPHRDLKLHWVQRNLENPASAPGQALASLMFGLFDHLNNCVLLRPPVQEYLLHIFKGEQFSTKLLDLRSAAELMELAGQPLPEHIKDAIEKNLPEVLKALKCAESDST